MNESEIARAEGVSSGGVCDSRKGVKNLRRYFEKKKWIERLVLHFWNCPQVASDHSQEKIRQLENRQKILQTKRPMLSVKPGLTVSRARGHSGKRFSFCHPTVKRGSKGVPFGRFTVAGGTEEVDKRTKREVTGNPLGY